MFRLPLCTKTRDEACVRKNLHKNSMLRTGKTVFSCAEVELANSFYCQNIAARSCLSASYLQRAYLAPTALIVRSQGDPLNHNIDALVTGSYRI